MSGKELSVSKNKNFKKIQSILVDNFKFKIAPHVVEELVQSHYKENKKIVSLEGVLTDSLQIIKFLEKNFKILYWK